ncbi:MAG: DegT/DnrJ/EryC1/StrS family aminotransferase [Hyphomicrobiales bacterium]|nr:DegT/DnrJ/EryC1/StrS family aminotransferase [Hyphomicrobiales bacterium]MBV8826236.1 DegT/DnrJ/EryC1/StrS family aminotransferase [Hyphomicrobiales bacterium]MBV9427590.1 DegT/DnrJ/EryC1/StrS family aminotransferase [Bradyrhizobiaceae bacterium]
MNQQPRFAPIRFVDVAAQRRRLGTRIDEAIARVLAHCQFIMGPEVAALEEQLAAFCGARHALGCASGTDALLLALMAKGIGPGDAVICPAFTFCASAEAVVLVGATPVFADVDEATFNLDPSSLEGALAAAKRSGLRSKAVMTVDLFGLPAAYDAITDFAVAHGLAVIADAAQSFGAVYHERAVGTLAPITTTSFFPSKPLSCYGDGGAVFTDDNDLAALMRSLRVHGQGADKYDNVRIGINGRLDTIQAAVLIEKLAIFAEELAARERIARRYDESLHDVAIVPRVPEGFTSVWALYTIRLPSGVRDHVMAALAAQGIPTGVYYPKPLHRQVAYRHYPAAGNGLPVTDRLADEVLSLPMHAYLDEPTQDRIVGALRAALGK